MILIQSAFLLLLATAPTFAADMPSNYTICYLSMNSEKEFHTTKEFMDKLNAVSAVNIDVKEFQTVGTDPDASFRKMIESGVKCDGLVISGHHTGDWGGKRAWMKLRMSFLEKLSCDPKYEQFFRNVNALWLQGCRTLGVGDIVPGNENDEEYDPEYHVHRVGAEIEGDNIDTGDNSFVRLSMEFTNTLDQDNPLSSRYLRLFPNAKVFGWTKSAPGEEKAYSERSLLYHMAHTSKILEGEDELPENPLSSTFSPQAAVKYMNAVIATLHRYERSETSCNQIAIQGWQDHGNYRKNPLYSYDNPDLESELPLESNSQNLILDEAHIYNCILKDAATKGDVAAMRSAFRYIASKPALLPYLFNTMVDLRNELKAKNNSMANTILSEMQAHPRMRSFLEKKIASQQVGLLRKADYYAFYKDLTGQRDPGLEQLIERKSVEVLTKPILRNSARSHHLAKNYRATLFQSLRQNGIVSESFFSSLLANQPEEDVLSHMAYNLEMVPDKAERMRIWSEIARSPYATQEVGDNLLLYLTRKQHPNDIAYRSSKEYEARYMEILGTEKRPGRLRGVFGKVKTSNDLVAVTSEPIAIPDNFDTNSNRKSKPGRELAEDEKVKKDPFKQLGRWLGRIVPKKKQN